jgi:putative CocE/NonD family hydrolase
VLTYTSEPLEEDLHLAGDVTLEVWLRSDAPDFDLSAVVSEVTPEGRAFTLTQSHARIEEGARTGPLRLSLRAICCRIPRGRRLRLSLAGACFPAYAINPGTGAQPGDAALIDQRVITLFVATAASRLILPVG